MNSKLSFSGKMKKEEKQRERGELGATSLGKTGRTGTFAAGGLREAYCGGSTTISSVNIQPPNSLPERAW